MTRTIRMMKRTTDRLKRVRKNYCKKGPKWLLTVDDVISASIVEYYLNQSKYTEMITYFRMTGRNRGDDMYFANRHLKSESYKQFLKFVSDNALFQNDAINILMDIFVYAQGDIPEEHFEKFPVWDETIQEINTKLDNIQDGMDTFNSTLTDFRKEWNNLNDPDSVNDTESE